MNFLKAKKKYDKISLQARKRLVNMVLENNCPLRQAGESLGIKLSTGKIILKKYKEEGVFFESKANKRKRLDREGQQAIIASNQFTVSLVQEVEIVGSIQQTPLNYQCGYQWPIQIIPYFPNLWEYEHLQLYYFIPFQANEAI